MFINQFFIRYVDKLRKCNIFSMIAICGNIKKKQSVVSVPDRNLLSNMKERKIIVKFIRGKYSVQLIKTVSRLC